MDMGKVTRKCDVTLPSGRGPDHRKTLKVVTMLPAPRRMPVRSTAPVSLGTGQLTPETTSQAPTPYLPFPADPWVEQKTFNLLVEGSNPSRPTNHINHLRDPCLRNGRIGKIIGKTRASRDVPRRPAETKTPVLAGSHAADS